MIVNISVGLGLITDGSIAVCCSPPANTANLDTKKQSYQPPLASIMLSGINIENMENEETKTLVLNQIDTIIEKYSPERGEKFFKKDVCLYLINVGHTFRDIPEYYKFSKKQISERIYNALRKEANWVIHHCEDYALTSVIHPRLLKLRERFEKMLTPKQTQAEKNAEFQKTVLERLENIENNINHIITLCANRGIEKG